MDIWLRLSTRILTDPKFLAAGPEAGFVWVKGLAYAKEHLTDGFVPREMLPMLALGCRSPKEVCKSLVGAGLWVECEGGYTVGSEKWARHQTTKSEVDAKREFNRQRQQRFRSKRNGDLTRDAEVSHGPVTQPENRVQRAENRAQSTESRAQSTESRVQRAENRVSLSLTQQLEVQRGKREIYVNSLLRALILRPKSSSFTTRQ